MESGNGRNSCISTKDLTYLQPNVTSKSDSIKVAQEVSKPYRIQTNDILSVNIKALDQKLVEMFLKMWLNFRYC